MRCLHCVFRRKNTLLASNFAVEYTNDVLHSTIFLPQIVTVFTKNCNLVKEKEQIPRHKKKCLLLLQLTNLTIFWRPGKSECLQIESRILSDGNSIFYNRETYLTLSALLIKFAKLSTYLPI